MTPQKHLELFAKLWMNDSESIKITENKFNQAAPCPFYIVITIGNFGQYEIWS